jgi:hypothetical protein
MDVVQVNINELKTIGKFPLIVSLSRLAPINRTIHELDTSPTPVDVLPPDFSGKNMDFPRRIRIVDNSDGNANEGVIVTLTGNDAKGKQIIENVTIPGGDGIIDTNNAFLYLSRIQADEVLDDSIELRLSNSFGFALDLGSIVFNALAQSNGSNSSDGEVIHASDSRLVVDEEYDIITIDEDILSEPGTHLSFFFA